MGASQNAIFGSKTPLLPISTGNDILGGENGGWGVRTLIFGPQYKNQYKNTSKSIFVGGTQKNDKNEGDDEGVVVEGLVHLPLLAKNGQKIGKISGHWYGSFPKCYFWLKNTPLTYFYR